MSLLTHFTYLGELSLSPNNNIVVSEWVWLCVVQSGFGLFVFQSGFGVFCFQSGFGLCVFRVGNAILCSEWFGSFFVESGWASFVLEWLGFMCIRVAGHSFFRVSFLFQNSWVFLFMNGLA